MTESDHNEKKHDEVCRSESRIDELDAESSQLIYEPRVEERPGRRLDIIGKRENPDVIAWGFWGGILAAAVAGFVLLRAGTTTLGVGDTLIASALLLTGLGLYKLGRKSTLDDELLCELDLQHRILSWPTSQPGNFIAVAFDDIEAISFALAKVPVANSKSGTRLEAATVSIVDDRGREIPVIGASTSKEETHRVARLLAKATDLSVDYVDTGVGEWANKNPFF